MKTFSTGLALASLAASAAAVPALVERNNDNKYQGTPGGTVKFGNGPPSTIKDPTGNNTIKNPVYRAISEFDYASFNLGLYQEWIELDLFNYGLKRFSDAEWEEAGVTADYRSLLQFMANQETGHAQLLTNILGPGAAKQCTYNYSTAFNTVREYNDFNQQLTRWGESGVWGFLTLLNSRPAAHLLSQSIATEARQQMVFRQFAGASAMPVYFEPGIPQAWSWTLLAPYIQSCPKENPRVEWSNFPKLNVDNNPTLRYEGSRAAVSTNITQLVNTGETIYFSWEDPGKKVGPDLSYTTSKNGGTPTHALWVHQINATLAPLTITGPNSGYAKLPAGDVYDTEIAHTGPAINGTGFVALVDSADTYTVYNLSLVIPHMVAGPAIFQSG
ncbi:hypothetical protein P389DRAFT_76656 [Cystobasidium minutum MCA 4210]|uniref:uncharacterized protein n=1 Tax=Cystobasidium minutum MCA 4210 TaxID=1397322 RepID=UPI0034CD73ED|eukprot:jgi/Rhomi1/76656/CE76655_8330